jgi:hypothetical protein
MYCIRNTKCILVEGGLDMLDSIGMDRWEIKYELFSSLAGKAVQSFYKFKYNTYRHNTYYLYVGI